MASALRSESSAPAGPIDTRTTSPSPSPSFRLQGLFDGLRVEVVESPSPERSSLFVPGSMRLLTAASGTSLTQTAIFIGRDSNHGAGSPLSPRGAPARLRRLRARPAPYGELPDDSPSTSRREPSSASPAGSLPESSPSNTTRLRLRRACLPRCAPAPRSRRSRNRSSSRCSARPSSRTTTALRDLRAATKGSTSLRPGTRTRSRPRRDASASTPAPAGRAACSTSTAGAERPTTTST